MRLTNKSICQHHRENPAYVVSCLSDQATGYWRGRCRHIDFGHVSGAANELHTGAAHWVEEDPSRSDAVFPDHGSGGAPVMHVFRLRRGGLSRILPRPSRSRASSGVGVAPLAAAGDAIAFKIAQMRLLMPCTLEPRDPRCGASLTPAP